MKQSIFAIMLLILFSCMSSPKNKEQYLIKYDTILNKNGTYLIYKNITDSTYIMEWGNDSVSKESIDTINILPSGKLNLEWHNENAICIRQSCGTACFYAYILPLSTSQKEKIYFYPLAFNQDKNLIAFNDVNKRESFIVVENFITGKRIVLNEDYSPGPFQGWSIDSIVFNSKGLFVEWLDSKDQSVSKVFEIY